MTRHSPFFFPFFLPRRCDLAVLGADATSVMISLPRRAVPRRSTRRQPDATATGDDDRDPSMPELGERGYCSSDEEPEYEPPRTRRRGVFDHTPPGQIGTAVPDGFPPRTVPAALSRRRCTGESLPKGGESVSDNPASTEAGDDWLTQRCGDEATPPAQVAPTEERRGAALAVAADVVAAAEGAESAAAAEGAESAAAAEGAAGVAPARTRQLLRVACRVVVFLATHRPPFLLPSQLASASDDHGSGRGGERGDRRRDLA